MDKVLMMAFERLSDEHEKLKKELAELKVEFNNWKNQQPAYTQQVQQSVFQDELLDLKEVQSMLGICYNSLTKLIKKGLIVPVRINERRIRFTKLSILKYIQTQSHQS